MTVVKPARRGKGTPESRSRQEQKAQNRARIAASAMELFGERGFEQVSVVEVAAAAGVTEKTVFNHFPTKEDLVYSNDPGFEEGLLGAVRGRRRGDSVVDGLRSFLVDTYRRGLSDEPEVQRRARTLARLVSASPALRAREREILSRYADLLRDQLADELGAGPDDLRPAVLAGAVMAVHRAVIDGYRQGLLDGESFDTLVERMVTAAIDALDLVAACWAASVPGGRGHPRQV